MRAMCLLLLVCALGACDGTAKVSGIIHHQADELYVIGAVPYRATDVDGALRDSPVCRPEDGAPDGLLLQFVYKGYGTKGGSDLDLAIRPGDRIIKTKVTEARMAASFGTVSLSCIEEALRGAVRCALGADCAPGETCDPSPGKGFCVDALASCYSGVQVAGVPVEDVSYRAHTPERGVPIGVAILVDMSGSNKGFVKPYPPYHEVDNQDPSGLHEDALTDFLPRGSDPNGTRMNAVKTIIENLNEDDRSIVFGFNEYGIDVVCALPGDPDADDAVKKDNCYTSNKSITLGSGRFGPLDDYKSQVGGRSPLWTAIYEAYGYMRDHPRTQATPFKHIVVITDGPDTCAEGPDLDRCSGPCAEDYNATWEETRNAILQDPYTNRIPVHFIQYQAKGYRDRDPRQMELACLTGGHHLFMNSLEFDKTILMQAFQDKARLLRYTFGGIWEAALPLAALGDEQALPPGRVFGVAGAGSLVPGDESLVGLEQHFIFELTNDAVDRRVHVRKPCATDADCPGPEEQDPCGSRVWWCGEQDHVCRAAAAWSENGGGRESCGHVDAVVRIQNRDLTGGTGTSTHEVSLGDVPSVCCTGACTPPAPPTVPEGLAEPDGTVCFEYDHEKGWTFDEDEEEWVYWAEHYLQPGCPQWTEVKPAIAYGVNANPGIDELTWPEHWDCPDRENCFPPGG